MADSLHYIGSRTALVLEITTDDGLVGIGESAIYGGPASVVETVIHDELAPRLLGQDPTQPERLWARMTSASHQHGDGGILPASISGLDIALWDLLGQRAGLPLWRLLGGYRNQVQAYASAGFYMEGKDAAGLADEVRGYVDRGYRHAKIKVGRTEDTFMNPLVDMESPDFALVDLGEDLRRVRAVREAVGDDVHVMTDANNAWTASTALRAGREYDRLGIHWFEEPVPTEDRAGSAALAVELDCPIAGYETQTGLPGFRDLIAARAVDIVQPDVIWSGGITPCRRIAALAAAAGLPVVPHVFSTAVSLAANLHFIAALPNSYLLEFDQNPNSLRTELLDRPIEPDARAVVTVPEGPGLGVKLDHETLRARATAPPRTSEAASA
ncbi:MAG: mandelate racemase/muconate lactonizing enzyme family protein [uncultured Thermoleophilia bacterium]|uniref:Mandelate racemase/muconate lactonizing enzyme family protein n=1 Tax=uncultured Thermoleophilia bacterium TaxID=1497501 RepID=A0A6J4TBI7_9ACTN|nr:MAG: mandelate racemase/muconate lactonizing enzyme family protein [uncultured Thermoleophilia bacterium]